MKYLRLATALLLLALIPIGTVFQEMASAQRFTTFIPRSETVDGSVYSSGNTVHLYGTINGDIFCAGKEVTINGVVNGDVICAARDVAIVGRVNGDVRVAGKTVFIDAAVARSVTVAASDFTLDVGATIGRDLTVNASTQRIKGDIDRDVITNGSTIIVAGGIGRNVTAKGKTLRLGRDSVIGGNLSYSHDTNLNKDSKAEVFGKTTRQAQPKRNRGLLAGLGLAMYLFILFGLLLVGLVLVLLFPGLLLKTSSIIKMSFLKTLLVGLVASILVPIAIFLVAGTIVGLPLALALLVAWLLVLIVSGPVAAFWLGRIIMRDKTKSLPLIIAVGAIVLATLYVIPVVGMLLLTVACWLGIGALVLGAKRHGRTRPDDNREAPDIPLV